ncbi:hypothetical protein TVAG_154740 [Trichomonas vaginalis G3]|uniref:Uncharacterized protein n=1 Tax=Trichomonas vaginalis (strain ATCC PRA-98 / G3) TaxID=412133 RepID=A2F265_TRIV3|nr:WD40 repeat-containing protein [Trichomonas vaginalis G3]EAY01004.1 hypothetical protein TVAG_154740 [Trichomonas vaginalis G3]KAI5548061.1 WD40 repeat-containing protein [Trichomonas vaginalis G3]|eukprot:XP_001313901.1 hypothetical protein [Trichomonas vaginalis G3]
MATRKFTKTGEIFIEPKKGVETPSFVYVTASAQTNLGAASSSDCRIYTFDSAACKSISNFPAHTGVITGLKWNDKSQILASCSSNTDTEGGGNEFKLWDIRTNKNFATFYPDAATPEATCIECCDISCDGTIYACGTDFGIFTWDIRRPECKHNHVNIMSDTVASIQFHPTVNSTFVAGDDDGNLLIYDLDGEVDEDGDDTSVIFAENDRQPIFQCGFCGTNRVFTLRRIPAGIAIWDFIEQQSLADFDDIKPMLNDCFGYPIDIHWAGDYLMFAGGDSEGGVALSLVSENGCTLFHKIEKAHNDCVMASHISICDGGDLKLFLAGDGGQLSFWKVTEA